MSNHRPRAMRHHALVLSLAVWAGACGSSAAPEEGDSGDDTIVAAYLAAYPDILSSHEHWHSESLRGEANYGEAFLEFHGKMVGAYEAWRLERGYGPVPAWDPSDPIPAAAHHAGQVTHDPSAVDPLCRTPDWLRVDGATVRDPDFGAGRLIEFTSADQLGRSIDSLTPPNWHSRVHATVGGDLASLHAFPRDPLFWRFHKFIDELWRQWQSATAPDDGPSPQ